jgi:hypothetical protein
VDPPPEATLRRTGPTTPPRPPAKCGIEATFVDITDLAAVHAAVRPNTRVVHTELVADPGLRVADLAALADFARGAGVGRRPHRRSGRSPTGPRSLAFLRTHHPPWSTAS